MFLAMKIRPLLVYSFGLCFMGLIAACSNSEDRSVTQKGDGQKKSEEARLIASEANALQNVVEKSLNWLPVGKSQPDLVQKCFRIRGELTDLINNTKKYEPATAHSMAVSLKAEITQLKQQVAELELNASDPSSPYVLIVSTEVLRSKDDVVSNLARWRPVIGQIHGRILSMNNPPANLKDEILQINGDVKNLIDQVKTSDLDTVRGQMEYIKERTVRIIQWVEGVERTMPSPAPRNVYSPVQPSETGQIAARKLIWKCESKIREPMLYVTLMKGKGTVPPHIESQYMECDRKLAELKRQFDQHNYAAVNIDAPQLLVQLNSLYASLSAHVNANRR
jgi:hypothetical protein